MMPLIIAALMMALRGVAGVSPDRRMPLMRAEQLSPMDSIEKPFGAALLENDAGRTRSDLSSIESLVEELTRRQGMQVRDAMHVVNAHVLLVGVPQETFDEMSDVKDVLLASLHRIFAGYMETWMSPTNHVKTGRTPGSFSVVIKEIETPKEGKLSKDTVIHVAILVSTHDDGNHVLSYLLDAEELKEIRRKIRHAVEDAGGRGLRAIRPSDARDEVVILPEVQDPPTPLAVHHTPTALQTSYHVQNLPLGGNRSGVRCARDAYARLVHAAFRRAMGGASDLKVSYDHQVRYDEVITRVRCIFPSDGIAEAARLHFALSRKDQVTELGAGLQAVLPKCGEGWDDHAIGVKVSYPQVEQSSGAEATFDVWAEFRISHISEVILDLHGSDEMFREAVAGVVKSAVRKRIDGLLSPGNREMVHTEFVGSDLLARYEAAMDSREDAARAAESLRSGGSEMAKEVQKFVDQEASAATVVAMALAPKVAFEGAFGPAPATATERPEWDLVLVLDIIKISWPDLQDDRVLWREFDTAVMHAVDWFVYPAQDHQRHIWNRGGSQRDVQMKILWTVDNESEANAFRDRLGIHEKKICEDIINNIKVGVYTDINFINLPLGHPHAMFYGPPSVWRPELQDARDPAANVPPASVADEYVAQRTESADRRPATALQVMEAQQRTVFSAMGRFVDHGREQSASGSQQPDSFNLRRRAVAALVVASLWIFGVTAAAVGMHFAGCAWPRRAYDTAVGLVAEGCKAAPPPPPSPSPPPLSSPPSSPPSSCASSGERRASAEPSEDGRGAFCAGLGPETEAAEPAPVAGASEYPRLEEPGHGAVGVAADV